MNNLKVILALTMVATFVITSCNKEELFQNSDTTKEILSSNVTDNAFMDLVKDDVYPVNLLSTKTIKAFSESIVMLGDEIASINGTVLKADLKEDQINLFLDLLAERDFDRANIGTSENIESRFRCYWVANRSYDPIYDCKVRDGHWCKVCPVDPID